MADKGVLYAKIDLTSIGGKFLHLFSLHTQASYIESSVRFYVETFVSRYTQVKETREVIM